MAPARGERRRAQTLTRTRLGSNASARAGSRGESRTMMAAGRGGSTVAPEAVHGLPPATPMTRPTQRRKRHRTAAARRVFDCRADSVGHLPAPRGRPRGPVRHENWASIPPPRREFRPLPFHWLRANDSGTTLSPQRSLPCTRDNSCAVGPGSAGTAPSGPHPRCLQPRPHKGARGPRRPRRRRPERAPGGRQSVVEWLISRHRIETADFTTRFHCEIIYAR